jgi:hypothetical protein
MILDNSWKRSKYAKFNKKERESYLIVDDHCGRVVSHDYSTGGIAKDTVFLDPRETATRSHDSRTLVFINVVLCHIGRTIKQHNAVIVIVDTICLDPSIARFNGKDALRT